MTFDNINTDTMLHKLLNQLKEFDATHERGEIPDRKDLINYLILRLRIESPDDYLITTEHTSESIDITVASEEILYINEVPTLKQLIQIANSFKIYPKNGTVILKITCPLWEWKKKTMHD